VPVVEFAQVGTIALRRRSKEEAELQRMYVDRGMRGRGIAKRLVQVNVTFLEEC
jgi:predicted GNAT family acetyltransferase